MKLAIKKLEPWQNPNEEPYISIENISKNFGNFPAVVDFNLEIYKGEFFSLLGGSGCGKSTLLRMLAGFEQPTSGKIYIDGMDMTNIPPYERPVNMMFQSYALFPHMTVEQNVAFGLKQENMAKSEIKDRVYDLLDLVELKAFAKRKPNQLSGGQRQRTALARSLAKQPKVLLLDEPLAALDKKLRDKTQFELVNIQEEVGVTFIMVTHDQEEAMTMSTRVGVMEQGRIRQVGAPREVYEYPNSRFSAEFIGSINLFDGLVVEEERDHALVRDEENDCTLYISHSASVPLGSQATVAIRPEKVTITKTPPKTDRNFTKGEVEEIAYLGDVSIYHVRLKSGKLVMATVPNLQRGAALPIEWEEEVYLKWNSNSGIILTA